VKHFVRESSPVQYLDGINRVAAYKPETANAVAPLISTCLQRSAGRHVMLWLTPDLSLHKLKKTDEGGRVGMDSQLTKDQ
jgi:hypothetical protein